MLVGDGGKAKEPLSLESLPERPQCQPSARLPQFCDGLHAGKVVGVAGDGFGSGVAEQGEHGNPRKMED